MPLLIYFYSHQFLLFFASLFCVYWAFPKKWQNWSLLLASYTFYASWDYRFLSLILLSTFTDYFCGKKIYSVKGKKEKKRFLLLSLFVNLGMLGYFKYANFFIESFNSLLNVLGAEVSISTLQIILPLGISFYTFQTLSYTIDIYRGKLKPVQKPLDFALFIACFPQLIAGPIERAAHLLPQLQVHRHFKDVDFKKAFYLLLYGMFKKRVLADNLAVLSEMAYDNPSASGTLVALGFLGFTFQAYFDVSGYAHMARGLALFLGINLSKNFDFPYYSTNPAMFWKKWHITLSMWVRHYLFVPLLIRLKNPFVAILLSFAIMGLWHGPRMHFIHWGIYWSLVLFLYHIYKTHMQINWAKQFFSKKLISFICMFFFALIGQSFYRAQDYSHYFQLVEKVFSDFSIGELGQFEFVKFYFCMIPFFLYEMFPYKKKNEFALLSLGFWPQAMFYVVLYFFYRNLSGIAAVDFIYFHF